MATTAIYSVRLCSRPAHTLPEWAADEFGWYAVETDDRNTWSEWHALDVPAAFSAPNLTAAVAAAAAKFGVQPEMIARPA